MFFFSVIHRMACRLMFSFFFSFLFLFFFLCVFCCEFILKVTIFSARLLCHLSHPLSLLFLCHLYLLLSLLFLCHLSLLSALSSGSSVLLLSSLFYSIMVYFFYLCVGSQEFTFILCERENLCSFRIAPGLLFYFYFDTLVEQGWSCLSQP